MSLRVLARWFLDVSVQSVLNNDDIRSECGHFGRSARGYCFLLGGGRLDDGSIGLLGLWAWGWRVATMWLLPGRVATL